MRLLLASILVLAFAAPCGAQVEVPATLTADVGSLARLTFSSTTLTFPDADPDVVPVVTAVPSDLTIVAKSRAVSGATVLLTVLATDDLRSGVDTLPASNITWTAAGPGFVPGTLSRSIPQTVASWSGSGVRSGTQRFAFRNLWTYPTGVYTVTLLYTLAAP